MLSTILSWKNAGLAIVFLWFFVGGISHFTDPEFFVAIMPPWIGWHLEIVYISGVFEVLGAIGILIPKLRQWAGNGLFLLTICVTPANIHMWLNPDLFPDVPETFLSVRLIIQVVLLAIIWRSTRTST
ncbi:hypothetical protein EY643_01330 [Halioglobus maricola]|uniref:DoxX family protein n=1 Tax=Halioglobus maricola TaxID=2601894 RepID=A0A5P9NF62_9GAMM|nr:DoxX family protein [Halioglobus maricola]QFU74400.1 hypothetical protein EY643_01330 [Halioglobus maricola]